ncbi:MAG: 4-alpha-glucanotransferase [Alphaproteobacteria bacterium]|nr:4-alpha-glucanotransferase [Alphaproteobacteria bacterium]MDE2111261.1 4-alpha-glucanotransferase [Alphaproteobacteria bacterium]
MSRLADAAGIEPRYWDIHGRLHETPPETARSLLRAMGIAADSEEDVFASLAKFEDQLWRTPLPPVVVARENSEIDVNLRLPSGTKMLRWSVYLEMGGFRTGECNVDALPVEDTRQFGDTQIHLRRLRLPPLPPGYHDLRLAGGASCRLIVAPQRCYLPPIFSGRRCWGIAAQLYALRSSGDWGIGDFGDLQELIEQSAARDADAIGLNPLHALFLDTPDYASPYSPCSRLFRNPLYLDVAAVPDFAECEEARALIEASDTARLLQAARDAAYVDYKSVARIKLAALECLHRSFEANHNAGGDARRAAFQAYEKKHGRDLERFATFQMLSEHFQMHDWLRWPAACRDPQSTQVAQLRVRHADRVSFYKYLQWQCDEQVRAAAELSRRRGMAIGLYNDLAISAEGASADHWANQDLFAGTARIGAPPDPFNETGQEWGVVPLNPFRLRATGYAHFIALLRANMRRSGALRIDHVMGWQRLFLIPAGEKPAAGAYVRYPIDDLLAVAALESRRHRCMLIGEDLGTVPAGFRERMAAANVLSCRIFAFERDHDRYRRPGEYPQLGSVSAATHDLATLRGFWLGDDITAKARLGLFKSVDEEESAWSNRAREKRELLQALAGEALLPQSLSNAEPSDWSPELAKAVHVYLARTQSLLFMVQLDDLAGETSQANLPGSTSEHPNWRRRHARTIADLLTDTATQSEMDAIAVARAK